MDTKYTQRDTKEKYENPYTTYEFIKNTRDRRQPGNTI